MNCRDQRSCVQKTLLPFLKGKADIAVIGIQSFRIMEERGISSLDGSITGLVYE
jgi:hypothetical protein